jgi:hypothetical protein
MSLLTERAMLVRPSISVWRGEVLDRAASKDTAERHKADRHQVKTTKYLIAKAAVDPIHTAANGLRSFVRHETLPWRWDGVGLLPVENFFPFTEGWRIRRMEFEAAVNALTLRWSQHVANGQRALGDLAREFDYPTREQVQARFSVNVEMFPVPDAEDFRAGVAEDEAEAIRLTLVEQNNQDILRMQSFMWQEMTDAVTRIVDRLSEYEKDADGKVIKGRIHDSLIGNLSELTDRLSRLNVTKDPALEAMRQQLSTKLCGYTPDDLKKDDYLREQVKDEAVDLLDQLRSVLNPQE